MKRTVFIFAALVVALLCLFKLSKYALASDDHSIESIIALIALVFFFIGIYLNKKSLHNRIPNQQHENTGKIEQSVLSKREYEVLLEISKGLSNREIADTLFVSESTVKTHVSNILVKLDSKRRTQLIIKAKKMGLVPY